MAYPAWPTALGDLRPSIRGVSIQAVRPRLLTEYDDGAPRMRRKSLVDTTTFSGFAIVGLSPAKLTSLQTFLRDTLNGGALRFQAPVVQTSGQVATCPCRIDRGPTYTYTATALATATMDLLVWGWR